MSETLPQFGSSVQVLWIGECPPAIKKWVRSYNIKTTSWKNLNHDPQPHFQLLFLAPGPDGLYPKGFSQLSVVRNTQARVYVCMCCAGGKRAQSLSAEILGVPPEDFLTTAADVKRFLEERFKTTDIIRNQVKEDGVQKGASLAFMLSIFDAYDHPVLWVDTFGRILFKNSASTHLFKGVYFPASLSDLIPLGRFFVLIHGEEHLIQGDQLLKRQIFPKVFKGLSEYLVVVERIRRLPFGPAYLLVFKDRGKFEVEKTSSFFLDSRVVIQSMFHELSSPVTSIGLGLEILKDQRLGPELAQDVKYCLDAYHRLKALTSDLPQFFAWEDVGLKARPVRIDSLADDLSLVLNVQLQRQLKYKQKGQRQLLLLGKKQVPKILCVRSTLFQAFQELVHFLLDFCSVDKEQPPAFVLSPVVTGNKFYLDLTVSGGIDFSAIGNYHRAFSEQQEDSVHRKSLGLREAVKHAYLAKISNLFQVAGFRLWVFTRVHEATFRVEYVELLKKSVRSGQLKNV